MTLLTTGAALLQGILDDPDDDTIRLVYADWLEENGQGERAEFIRVQCHIAALQATCRCVGCVRLRGGGRQHHNGPCAVDQERPSPKRRQGELLRQGYFDWSPFDHEFHKRCHQAISYRRGFVHSVACPCDDFRHHAAAIFAAHPVEEVRLTDKQPLWVQALWVQGMPLPKRWVCYPHHPARYERVLPPEIFKHLLPDPDCIDSQFADGKHLYASWCDYATAEHADAGLSRACVRLGRATRAREARQHG